MLDSQLKPLNDLFPNRFTLLVRVLKSLQRLRLARSLSRKKLQVFSFSVRSGFTPGAPVFLPHIKNMHLFSFLMSTLTLLANIHNRRRSSITVEQSRGQFCIFRLCNLHVFGMWEPYLHGEDMQVMCSRTESIQRWEMTRDEWNPKCKS